MCRRIETELLFKTKLLQVVLKPKIFFLILSFSLYGNPKQFERWCQVSDRFQPLNERKIHKFAANALGLFQGVILRILIGQENCRLSFPVSI